MPLVTTLLSSDAHLEGGRAYARGRSPDFLVWGIAVAAGDIATYAFVCGWTSVDPDWLWPFLIGIPWLYSLRKVIARLRGKPAGIARTPMAQAMGMLWLACGILLSTLAIGAGWFGVLQQGWFGATVAGVLGVGFFASASLCSLSWMRIVAVGWWIGEVLLLALHGRSPQLLVSAALMLMLLLFAGPGLFILRGRAEA